jgi:tryptophan-rich sensory protein
MEVAETLFVIIGTGLFAANAYYCWRILQNLDEQKETTLVMFFLRSAVATAFKVLSLAAATFAVGMLLAGLALIYDPPIFSHASKIGSVVFFLGLTYFLRTVSHETAPPTDET